MLPDYSSLQNLEVTTNTLVLESLLGSETMTKMPDKLDSLIFPHYFHWENRNAVSIRRPFLFKESMLIMTPTETFRDTTTITLESLITYFQFKSDKEIVGLFSKYSNEQTVKLITKERIVDPKRLCAVLFWLEYNYAKKYGDFTLNAFFDPEEGFQFLEINFPYGDWDEWKNLAREIKEEIRNSGLRDIASKVAVVCLEALQEQQH